MKKLVTSLLLVVLVVPSLAWAEEAKETEHPRKQKVSQSHVPMAIEGKIVSLSVNTVTIATRAGSKDKKTKAKYVKVQTSAKPELQGALFRGLGRKAQLLCRKTDKGAWVLVRVKSIKGVEVAEQERRWPGMMGEMFQRGKELSPEQREKMRERFRTMGTQLREKPALRKELRELAETNPEAFRRRIRQIREQAPGRPDTVRQPRGPMPPKPRRPDTVRQPRGPMPPSGVGIMGPRMGGGRRPSPESAEIRKLERQAQELAEQYRRAEEQKKEELGEKLRKTLTEVFEQKVQTQAKQVQRLEKQLEKLRDRLEKRQKNREAMIQKRFGQLTGQEEDLPW